MKTYGKAALAALVLAASSLWAADGVTFIGRGQVAGDALDKSGLTGNICQAGSTTNCIDKRILGGFGSGLTYVGNSNVFLAVPDRGPYDGRTDVPYLDRFHFLQITTDTNILPSSGTFNITTKLLDTRFLTNAAGQNYVGSSSAFSTVNETMRFDPEGVIVTRDGTFIVSDEYGPYIYEFDRNGVLVRKIAVPTKFLIDYPTGDVNTNGDSYELYDRPFISGLNTYGNDYGRQANRGMEGLAITPDGRYLIGIMQNALIQDNGLTYANPQTDSTTPSRVGRNNRILKYDLQTNTTQEFVYQLDAISQGKGVNEILAINDHEFLVLERDNRSLVSPGADPFSTSGGNCCGLKKIYKINLNGATDVAGFNSSVGQTFTPVTKSLFIDLLDPTYVVNSNGNTIKQVIAEKMEGMAWGPDLPDGRHVLYVISDNDLNNFPTQIYSFAIDAAAAGIHYQRQEIPQPLFTPGKLKKD